MAEDPLPMDQLIERAAVVICDADALFITVGALSVPGCSSVG